MIRPLAERIARLLLADEISKIHKHYAWLSGHAKQLEISLAEAEAEISRLRQRAGRDTPTPTEATMLAIVTERPGLTTAQISEERWRREHQTPPEEAVPWYAQQYATAPLRSLLLKGYVRREPTTGGTFRYWPVGGGAS